jgi:hypothetical protein
MIGLYDTSKNKNRPFLIFILCIIVAILGFLIGLEL